jgi:hypothetical protein
MQTDEIMDFLKSIDGELARHAEEGHTLDLYLIGRSALVLLYGLDLATKDIDILYFHGSRLQEKAVELFGKGTLNAERWGFYLEPVPQGLPPIPSAYCNNSEPIPGEWRVIRPKCPEPHDLAVTKLKRFHAKDREDLQIMCDSGQMRKDRLEKTLESAFAFAEKGDPGWERARANLSQVVNYLEGKTGSSSKLLVERSGATHPKSDRERSGATRPKCCA